MSPCATHPKLALDWPSRLSNFQSIGDQYFGTEYFRIPTGQVMELLRQMSIFPYGNRAMATTCNSMTFLMNGVQESRVRIPPSRLLTSHTAGLTLEADKPLYSLENRPLNDRNPNHSPNWFLIDFSRSISDRVLATSLHRTIPALDSSIARWGTAPPRPRYA